jgi:hypothetical protein
MTVKLTVAGNADPADPFMLYGLVTGRVETRGPDIEHQSRDIEGLNLRVSTARWMSRRSRVASVKRSRLIMCSCHTASVLGTDVDLVSLRASRWNLTRLEVASSPCLVS